MAMTTLPHIRTLRGPELLALLLLKQRAEHSDNPYRTEQLLEAGEPVPLTDALEQLEDLGLIDHPKRPNGKPYADHWDITATGEAILTKKGTKELASIDKHARATKTAAGLDVTAPDTEARMACLTRCRKLMGELGLGEAPKVAAKPKEQPAPARRTKAKKPAEAFDDGGE